MRIQGKKSALERKNQRLKGKLTPEEEEIFSASGRFSEEKEKYAREEKFAA